MGLYIIFIIISLITGISSGLNGFETPGVFRDVAENSKAPKLVVPPHRLPKHLFPTYTDLSLKSNLEQGTPNEFTTHGEVTISFKVAARTHFIRLSCGVEVQVQENSTKVTKRGSGEELSVTAQGYVKETFMYWVELDTYMEIEEEFDIYLQFVSKINNVDNEFMVGMYRSSYVDPASGERRWLVTTQFQDNHAQRLFPHFDEPAFKSEFKIRLGRNNKHHTRCNTEIEKTEPIEGEVDWSWDYYKPTPYMSSYLIAIVISDFTHVQQPGENISTWGVPELIAKGGGDYSLGVNSRALDYFEDLFGINYPLDKLDSAAIPDFESGAMENWGLVLYREDFLLVFPGETLESARKLVTLVINHELVHFWFGNLVTMEWWDHIWLNEGFARYFQYLGSEVTQPEFKGRDTIITDTIYPAFRYDALDVSVELTNPIEIPTVIIYDKGASLLNMISAFLTETTLISALRIYLNDHQYGNTIQDDLFDVLTTEGHRNGTLPPQFDMKEVMRSWTMKPGFPLIRITRSRLSNQTIYVSQERYFSNPQTTANSGNVQGDLWWVPISYISQQNPTFDTESLRPKFWLESSQPINYFNITDQGWILVNPGHSGYFRVLYEPEFTQQLKEQLDSNHSLIPHGSRSQLLDDYFNFAFSKYDKIETALEFTTYLNKEDDYTVWNPVLFHLRTQINLLSGNPNFESFRIYLLEKFSGALQLLGFRQESTDKGLPVILRANLLEHVCSFDHSDNSECFEYMEDLLTEWNNNLQNPVPVDIRDTMYCAMVASQMGITFAYDKYWEESGIEKRRWLHALTCGLDPAYIDNLLDEVFDDAVILFDDVIPVLSRLASNRLMRTKLIQFIDENFEKLAIYLDGVNVFSSVINSLANFYSSNNELERVTAFVENHHEKLDTVMESIQVSIAKIRDNVEWVNSFGNDILAWTAKNQVNHK